jgi:hypothetical protein
MDAAAQPSTKRPKLVWVVFFFYLFSVVYTGLSFFAIFSGSIYTPEQIAYFRNLSTLDWTILGVTATLNLAGATSMFQLRKIAFPLFAASLALSILQTLVHAFTTNFTTTVGSAGALGVGIGFAIAIAVCVYAWRLKERGVLA